MPRIPEIDLETAPGRVQEAVDAHVANGYRLTSEKKTLLHNVVAFQSLEESSYALDRELQRLVGKRAADLYEYAISAQNECLVCSAYFANLLKKNGTDLASCAFTDRENLLMEYGRAIAKNPKSVPDELFARMRREFTEEEIVVITAMGVLMIANNYFNDILQIEPEEMAD